MATELGKAYIQIVPSAKGISGAIKGQLDPEAASAGSSAGESLSGRLISVVKAAIVTAGIGKVIGTSITEGSALQQSLGGVETIFKTSAGKVKEYANQAYKTSGMSANSYMENVTSFSASLLQSLGGNTGKAADVANMAMIDMSDNANKFGSNMGDIQNAYQGFAKQNYTMLDNLKLGYGGTKSEMERLLADATKLTGVKYDINNLSDVYNAIHAIQGDLNITGTTAKEAATTFSGSFDSMKASAQNVLGNLALGKDLGPSLSALSETTSNFLLNNFLPMVTNIIKGLPGAIGTFATEFGSKLASAGRDGASQLGLALNVGLVGIGAQMSTALQPLVTGIQTMFGQLPALFTTVASAITPVIAMIANAITQMDFSGIQAVLSAIIPAISAGFSTMMAIIQPAIQGVITSFTGLWNAAQPLISMLASALMPAFQILGSFLGGVFKGALMGVQVIFDALKVVIQVLTPVVGVLVTAFKAIAPVLQTIAQWIGTVIGTFGTFGGAGTTLKSIMSSAWSGIKTAVSVAGTGIKAVIAAIKTVFSALGSAGGSLKGLLSAAWSGIKSAVSAAGSGIKSVVSAVKSVFTSLGSAGSSLKSVLSSAWSGITSAVSSAKGTISSVVSSIKSKFKSLGDINLLSIGKHIISGLIQGINSMVSEVGNAISRIANKVTSGIRKALKIHSPSRVTAELGMYTGKGFVNGIESMIPAAGKMADKLSAEAMMDTKDSTSFGLNPGQISKVTSVDFNQVNSANETESTIISQLNDVMSLLARDPQYQVVLDSGTLAGELTPKVDNQLATNWRKNDNKIGR